MKLFFVCRTSKSVCAVFKRNNFLYRQQNYKRTAATARPAAIEKVQCKLMICIFSITDFHVSEFPSKNVRFFILEKYTQKYFFSAAKISKY